MVCSNCGAENESNAKFCRGCGFPIVPESERPHPEPENNAEDVQDTVSEMTDEVEKETAAEPAQSYQNAPQQETQQYGYGPQQQYGYAPQYGYGPQQQYGMAGPAPNQQPGQYSGASIVGLIMGIVSIALCFTFLAGVGCGIAAICLGASQRSKDKKNGMATAALVLGIVGVSVTLILFMVLIATGVFAAFYEGAFNGGNNGFDWDNYSYWYDMYS